MPVCYINSQRFFLLLCSLPQFCGHVRKMNESPRVCWPSRRAEGVNKNTIFVSSHAPLLFFITLPLD